MFENRKDQLLPLPIFFTRLIRHVLLGLLIVILSLFIGMLGYHYYEHMSWTDAYVNAAMILSGMGPVQSLVTNDGKIFAGSYALFSGLVLILVLGIIYGPVVHRFLHKFHLEERNDRSNKD